MKIIPITELRGINSDFEIADVLPVKWLARKDFSLYKSEPRPHSALFFICADMKAAFFPENAPQVNAKKGDIVFIPRGSRYTVKVEGQPKEKIDTYTVNLRFFDDLHEEIILSHGIEILAGREDNLLSHHLENLRNAFNRVDTVNQQSGRNISRAKGEMFLLLDLIADSASQHKDFYYPIRRGVELFLREWNLNEKIEKYAQLCDMSETYFYRCFRKWADMSPVEYRNMLRMANAEAMLRCTNMKIKEISEAVGFDDPFYFCRLFSEKYGESPNKYRKAAKVVSN